MNFGEVSGLSGSSGEINLVIQQKSPETVPGQANLAA